MRQRRGAAVSEEPDASENPSSRTAKPHEQSGFGGAKPSNRLAFVLVPFVGACCCLNTLYGSIVWDDRAAVMMNKDVRAEAPLADLFVHDFWGTHIGHRESHKSYRPLTVLTFRCVQTIYHTLPYWKFL